MNDIEDTCDCTPCPYCGGLNPYAECAHGDICPGWFEHHVCSNLNASEREAVEAEWEQERQKEKEPQ